MLSKLFRYLSIVTLTFDLEYHIGSHPPIKGNMCVKFVLNTFNSFISQFTTLCQYLSIVIFDHQNK